LTRPGKYHASQRLDVAFRMLKDTAAPLKHSSEVKVFIGTSEVLGRVRVLGVDQLNPGDEGYLQIELRYPVVAVRGDRYILRRPSPGETLGGGVVLDPDPKGRHKRRDPAVLDRLKALTAGTPTEVLLQAALALGIVPLRDILRRARLEPQQAKTAVEEAASSGQLLLLEKDTPEGLAAHIAVWNRESARMQQEVAAFHAGNPLRAGMPREMLKNRLKLTSRVFQILAAEQVGSGRLIEHGPVLKLPDFEVRFSPTQQSKVDALLRQFAAAPYATPSVKESAAAVGDDLLTALLERGDLIAVSPEVLFRMEDYQRMREAVVQTLQTDGSLTAAQFRDRFNTSRKYALAFLEHLDALGVTVRDGDVRRLGAKAG